MASEATAFIKKVSSAGGDYCGILGIEEGATDDEIKKAYGKMALLLHPDKCQENGAAEAFKKVGEAYSKLLDGQSSGPTLKPTPKMSQKLRKQARSEMAKQRYGQNPGPNAHNEKPVPKEVPKEWLFEVNAPDIGNVSTTNDEHFGSQRDDGRVLSGEGSNGTTAATSNGSQADRKADREFESLGDTGGGGFGIGGLLHEWLQMPNLSLTSLGCCISRSK